MSKVKIEEAVKDQVIIEDQKELTDEEKALIEKKRRIKTELDECGKAIGNTLKQFNCELLVDLRSPMNNPRIILLHNEEKGAN